MQDIVVIVFARSYKHVALSVTTYSRGKEQEEVGEADEEMKRNSEQATNKESYR